MGAERACTFCFIEDVCTGSVLTNHILLSTSIIIKLTCAPSRVSSSSWGEVSTETKPMGKGRYLAEEAGLPTPAATLGVLRGGKWASLLQEGSHRGEGPASWAIGT